MTVVTVILIMVKVMVTILTVDDMSTSDVILFSVGSYLNETQRFKIVRLVLVLLNFLDNSCNLPSLIKINERIFD